MPIKIPSLRTLVLLVLLFPTSLLADEGMWPPTLINQAIFDRMKALGFALTPEQLYSVAQPSLKDAIVLFGRGCTAEIISNQGLLLTNHHCGHGQIQSHSSLQNDYLADGFWAKTKKDELANPGLTASILVRMEEVTPQATQGITPTLSEKEKSTLMDANIKKIMVEATKGTNYQAQVKPFFGGLQQWLLVYEVFTDVRLVGAPPSSIGKFGGDTDNWVWPRHTGDFCLFRIYAGKDNKPAAYSLENQPYVPKKYLPISTAGIKEGDFTMLLGYPGRTMEYLPSYALELVADVANPKKIALRNSRLEIINEAMKASQENRIKYASTQADIANAWKKWQGELLGMRKADAIGAKRKMEENYRAYFSKQGESGKPYLEALNNLKLDYGKMVDLTIPAQYQSEAVMANDIFVLVNATKRLLPTKGVINSDSLITKKIRDYKQSVKSIWRDVDPSVERQLFRVTMKAYATDIPSSNQSVAFLEMLKNHPFAGGKFENNFFDKGHWFDSVAVWKLAEKVARGDSNLLKKNPTFQLLSVLNTQFSQIYLPAYQSVSTQLDKNQQVFLTGQMEMEKGKAFYPDANQTFRVVFGQVAGYQPQDGVKYSWQTTTKGIMEKSGTEPDFILSPTLQSIFNKQNSSQQGPVPVAFIATNHSTGGNSGSPVLNARGELIGVNFDRVWEGTMSDYYFDSHICRNITCDIRYILWVVENVGQSGHLVREMEIR